MAAHATEEAAAAEQQLALKIKTINDVTLDVVSSPASLILDVKRLIHAQLSELPPERQRLIFRGRLLLDSSSLSSAGIGAGMTLHLVARVEDAEPQASEGHVAGRPLETVISSSDAAGPSQMLLRRMYGLRGRERGMMLVPVYDTTGSEAAAPALRASTWVRPDLVPSRLAAEAAAAADSVPELELVHDGVPGFDLDQLLVAAADPWHGAIARSNRLLQSTFQPTFQTAPAEHARRRDGAGRGGSDVQAASAAFSAASAAAAAATVSDAVAARRGLADAATAVSAAQLGVGTAAAGANAAGAEPGAPATGPRTMQHIHQTLHAIRTALADAGWGFAGGAGVGGALSLLGMRVPPSLATAVQSPWGRGRGADADAAAGTGAADPPSDSKRSDEDGEDDEGHAAVAARSLARQLARQRQAALDAAFMSPRRSYDAAPSPPLCRASPVPCSSDEDEDEEGEEEDEDEDGEESSEDEGSGEEEERSEEQEGSSDDDDDGSGDEGGGRLRAFVLPPAPPRGGPVEGDGDPAPQTDDGAPLTEASPGNAASTEMLLQRQRAAAAVAAANGAGAGAAAAVGRGGGGELLLRVGQHVDALDSVSQWLEATVTRVYVAAGGGGAGVGRAFVRLHFNGWSTAWDEWLWAGSARLAPFRARSGHTTLGFALAPQPVNALPQAGRCSVPHLPPAPAALASAGLPPAAAAAGWQQVPAPANAPLLRRFHVDPAAGAAAAAAVAATAAPGGGARGVEVVLRPGDVRGALPGLLEAHALVGALLQRLGSLAERQAWGAAAAAVAAGEAAAAAAAATTASPGDDGLAVAGERGGGGSGGGGLPILPGSPAAGSGGGGGEDDDRDVLADLDLPPTPMPRLLPPPAAAAADSTTAAAAAAAAAAATRSLPTTDAATSTGGMGAAASSSAVGAPATRPLPEGASPPPALAALSDADAAEVAAVAQLLVPLSDKYGRALADAAPWFAALAGGAADTASQQQQQQQGPAHAAARLVPAAVRVVPGVPGAAGPPPTPASHLLPAAAAAASASVPRYIAPPAQRAAAARGSLALLAPPLASPWPDAADARARLSPGLAPSGGLATDGSVSLLQLHHAARLAAAAAAGPTALVGLGAASVEAALAQQHPAVAMMRRAPVVRLPPPQPPQQQRLPAPPAAAPAVDYGEPLPLHGPLSAAAEDSAASRAQSLRQSLTRIALASLSRIATAAATAAAANSVSGAAASIVGGRMEPLVGVVTFDASRRAGRMEPLAAAAAAGPLAAAAPAPAAEPTAPLAALSTAIMTPASAADAAAASSSGSAAASELEPEGQPPVLEGAIGARAESPDWMFVGGSESSPYWQ